MQSSPRDAPLRQLVSNWLATAHGKEPGDLGALNETQLIFDHIESQGLVEHIGLSKSDARGNPVPADINDIVALYLWPFLQDCQAASEEPQDAPNELYKSLEQSLFERESLWTISVILNDFDTDLRLPVSLSNGVTLRRLSQKETHAISEELTGVWAIVLGVHDPQFALSLDIANPKAAGIGTGFQQRTFDDVVTSMRLLKAGGIRWNVNMFRMNGPKYGGLNRINENLIGWRLDTVSSGSQYTLASSDLADLNRLIPKVAPARTSQNPKLRMALDRLDFSYSRGRREDHLVDYWIALEALFLGSNETQELKYKAAVRICRYLEARAQEGETMFDELSRSYVVRSKVVHGEKPPVDLTAVTLSTGERLRNALRRAVLSESPPDLKSLDYEAARR